MSKESFEKLHTAFPGTEYALSWGVFNGNILTHLGSNGRWFAQIGIVPEKNAAFYLVINASPDTPQCNKPFPR